MEHFRRFAIYYAPEAGSFADHAAAWLGWDLAQGRAVSQPETPADLPRWTAEPRKYGFHGTIKPPFRVQNGITGHDLAKAVQTLAAQLPQVTIAEVMMAQIEGFLAILPKGDVQPLNDLASAIVQGLDGFRAPLTAAEIARRRPESLTERQRALLALYGYPYVMEEFQFHLTLTGRLSGAEMGMAQVAAQAHFAHVLPRPFVLRDICLCGEDEAGNFHLLHRYPLMA